MTVSDLPPFNFAGRGVSTEIDGNLRLRSGAAGQGNLTVDGTSTLTGAVSANGGVNTAGGVAVIASPGFSSGTASQLSDLTKDYMVYFQIGTGGGTVALAIGPANTTVNTIMTAAAGVSGELLSVRLPAGWFLKITLVTSTIAGQIAVSC